MHARLLWNKNDIKLNLHTFKLRNCKFLAIHSNRFGGQHNMQCYNPFRGLT